MCRSSSNHSVVHLGIDAREQQLLVKKVLKPIWLETHHSETVRKYRLRGFAPSAREHTFARLADDATEERQSVYDYFLDKYQMKLKYPNLPTVGPLTLSSLYLCSARVSLVELFTPPHQSLSHYLPMECCFIQAWQRCLRPLTTDQSARVTRKTVVDPTQRYETIMNIVHKRQFNEDRYVREIGMTVDEREMLTVNARCIHPPEIKYRSGRDGQSEVIERINIGK